MSQLESTLQHVLQDVNGQNSALQKTIDAMNSAFRVLPRVQDGGLTHSATSYLVHEYFTRNYQWHIRGMGPDSHSRQAEVAPLHGASILQDHAPELVENLLESREKGHGLTIKDAATMAETLHVLIRQDAVVLLEKSYELLGRPLDARIDGKQELVDTMLAFAYASSGQTDSQRIFKQRLHKPTTFMLEFSQNAINIADTFRFQQRHYANPFVAASYGFADLLDIVQRALEEFGTWQDSSCRTMKDHLRRLDPKGAGRVPLGVFYNQPDQGAYRFSESVEYLRGTGALDESTPEKPQVLISNYILGPGNCYSTSTYFQFCCINDCSKLMEKIEAKVPGPKVAPDILIEAATTAGQELSTEPTDEPLAISQALIDKLKLVAERHGGTVPIHGRLFAQWLHFAFPTECPYPHVPASESSNGALSASDFLTASAADPSVMQHHIAMSGSESSEPSLAQWTDDEMLSLMELPSTSPMRICFRIFAGGLALLATLATAIKNLKREKKCGKLHAGKFEHDLDKIL
jgi:hypothetical protein